MGSSANDSRRLMTRQVHEGARLGWGSASCPTKLVSGSMSLHDPLHHDLMMYGSIDQARPCSQMQEIATNTVEEELINFQGALTDHFYLVQVHRFPSHVYSRELCHQSLAPRSAVLLKVTRIA